MDDQLNQPPVADQSQFIEQQSAMQEPPEELARRQALALKPKNPKKKWLILGGIGFFVLLLILMVVFKPSPPQLPVAIAPTPTPLPQPPDSELTQQLKYLETLKGDADPGKVRLALPQVDMEVKF